MKLLYDTQWALSISPVLPSNDLGGLGHNIFSSKQGEGSASHSISSSARSSKDFGIANPSARAVFRLISSSYFVGCSIGRSPTSARRLDGSALVWPNNPWKPVKK